MHNNIMAAGSRDRPPMLATGRYAQWRSRFLRYIDTRPNGDALRKCILTGYEAKEHCNHSRVTPSLEGDCSPHFSEAASLHVKGLVLDTACYAGYNQIWSSIYSMIEVESNAFIDAYITLKHLRDGYQWGIRHVKTHTLSSEVFDETRAKVRLG
ncbi:hypothetical protein Tco_1004843 [Tanacetum coccineum]|uniref:Uncharacterized protein n=1 Tax=Tanacetum coccineum TaxID=301880 RepID=A0ABQ5FDC2_9ASTR